MEKGLWVGVIVGLSSVVLAGRADAAICYVGQGAGASDAMDVPDRGSESHPFATGTAAIAWKNVVTQHRICDDVRFLPGVYQQNVKVVDRDGMWSGPLRISATPGTVTIWGVLTTTDPDFARQATILVLDSSYVTIDGLIIRNDASGYCSPTDTLSSTSFCHAAGILVANRSVYNGPANGQLDGAAPHHVTIENNLITGVNAATMLTTRPGGVYTKCPTFDPSPASEPLRCLNRFDALPIAIVSYRDGVDALGNEDPSETTSNIIVRGNEINKSHVSSDSNNVGAIDLLGNVSDILIEGNQISRMLPRPFSVAPNAAFDMTGIQLSGARYDAARSHIANVAARPRRVVIRANTIESTTGSQIYVNSANNILIERNSFDDGPRGVQVATEGGEARGVGVARYTHAQQIWVRNNRFLAAHTSAIDLGMQGDDGAYRYSPIRAVYVTGNTFYSAPSASSAVPRVVIRLRRGVTGESMFANNIVLLDYSAAPSPCADGLILCDVLLSRVPDANFPIEMPFAANLWHVVLPTSEDWTKRVGLFEIPATTEFNGYRAGLEPGAIGEDPKLSQYSYTLDLLSSPARDAGIDATPSWLGGDLSNFGAFASGSIHELDFFGNARVDGAATNIGMQEKDWVP